MAIRIAADKDQPSATIEIPLEKALPDYDLNQLELPTPRDVDAILVSQGFRDLVDDARGILTELLSGTSLELAQLTGAICPGDEDRKSTRLNSSHSQISYAVFCLKKK